MAQLRIATQVFVTERRGHSEIINVGDIAEEGSWPVGLHPDAFQPLHIRWKAPTKAGAEPVSDASGAGAVSPATLKHRGGRGGKPAAV